MRLPRITIRRMMIVVALAGIALGLWTIKRRQEEFRELAGRHGYFAGMMGLDAWESREAGDHQRALNREEKQAIHQRLQIKYARAARYPWLPVEPDPPAPESLDRVK
jgi:hypothetical protein